MNIGREFLAPLLGSLLGVTVALGATDARSIVPGTDGKVEAADEGGQVDLAALARAASGPGEQKFWDAIFLLGGDEAAQKRGRILLREAGDLEYPPALTFLGECHLFGNEGFPKNPRRAAEWFRLAAERGDSPGKAYFGGCLFFATGVRRDVKAARAWLQQAVDDAPKHTPPKPPAWFLEKQEQRAKQAAADAREEEHGRLGARPTPWEALFARAHLHLGLLLEEQGDMAAALKRLEAAATWGEQGRAGIADAARKSALAYALGKGTPRDLAMAAERLELSRRLTANDMMSTAHSLWTDRKLDNFDFAYLEEKLNEQADARLEAEQEQVADSLLKENPTSALQWCLMAAEAGEGWAMMKLAEIHFAGVAGPTDPAAAFKWYGCAAEKADLWLAWANLAVCHARGVGTALSPTKASEIAAKRSKRNFACALVASGMMPDKDLSYRSWTSLLQQKARAGVPVAQYHYALFLLATASAPASVFPWLEERDPKDARVMLNGAAEAGLPQAMYELARLIETDEGGPFVVPARALDWYRKGMDAGSAECSVRLGILRRAGPLKPGDASARTYFVRAIELDPENAEAHFEHALSCETLLQIRPSGPNADFYSRRILPDCETASRLGSAPAAYAAGVLHREGRFTSRDPQRAYEFFQLAAERGVARANHQLAQMHALGEGVPRTPREADYYYRMGAAAGDLECLRKVCQRLQIPALRADAPESAIFWFVRLANSGDGTALVHVADILVELGRSEEARRLLQQLSKNGDRMISGPAFDRLGLIYEQGRGVRTDPRRAKGYFAKALADLCADTLCRDARRLLIQGKHKEGIAMLSRASASGSGEAACLLAELSFTGQIEGASEADGWRLMRLSVSRGYAPAKLALARFSADMRKGAPELAEALVFADEAEEGGLTEARVVRERLEAMRPQAPSEPTTEGVRQT